MLNFVVTASEVFTGDTLFKGSVGGVRAPGSTSFADLQDSIMDVLMELPPETVVRPGHTDPTTIGDEWEQQRVRAPLARPRRGGRASAARVGDEEATLVLWAPDYDGGHKAWVRWDDGRDDIVPGQPGRAQRVSLAYGVRRGGGCAPAWTTGWSTWATSEPR